MAIAYPLSIPTAIGIEQIELRANNVVAVSESPFTFVQQTVVHSGQRWEASVTIPPVRRDLAEPWIAFLLSLQGRRGTFLLGDPNMATPRGSAATAPGTPEVDGALSIGDSEITIDGLPTSATGYLKAGDYIQLGSGSTSTLHKVLADVDSDGGGQATIDIWPSVRRVVANNETVVVSNAKGQFRLAANISSWSINNSSAYGISFDAVEVI
jgi:hypothetical protein